MKLFRELSCHNPLNCVLDVCLGVMYSLLYSVLWNFREGGSGRPMEVASAEHPYAMALGA